MCTAVRIDAKDNVAVAIEAISRGEAATYRREGGVVTLSALEDIPIYHKLALRDISMGEVVIKYGEHIGVAARHIRAGEHVHVHNVEGRREALEAKA